MIERYLEHLAKLVGYNTVSERSNLNLIDYMESILHPFGFVIERVPSDDGQKSGLLASIGPTNRPGIVLSAHTDTVPVEGQNWSSDPFRLRIDDNRAFGRGTADMKGFIAVCLGLASELAVASLEAPIHFAFSYDEEIGCLGAPRLAQCIRDRYGVQLGVLVGEPTAMGLVVGHKGNTALEIVARGRAAHSSLAPKTVNAVDLLYQVQGHLHSLRECLAGGECDPGYDVPVSTICVTEISGGNAINIVPADCRMVVELRTLAGSDTEDIVGRLSESIASTVVGPARRLVPEADVHLRRLFSYPGLQGVESPFCTAVMRVSKSSRTSKVAYGTEAGIFNQILASPTVVIGPGSIEQAHRADEFIELSQLQTCGTFLRELLLGGHLRFDDAQL